MTAMTLMAHASSACSCSSSDSNEVTDNKDKTPLNDPPSKSMASCFRADTKLQVPTSAPAPATPAAAADLELGKKFGINASNKPVEECSCRPAEEGVDATIIMVDKGEGEGDACKGKPPLPPPLPKSSGDGSGTTVPTALALRNDSAGDGKGGKPKTKRVTFLPSPLKHGEDVVDLESGNGNGNGNENGNGVAAINYDSRERRLSLGDDAEQVCRVCHLPSDCKPSHTELVHIGCKCKDDMGMAHRHCAEAWFKIRGSRICEICGETAKNVIGSGDTECMEEWNEGDATNLEDERRRCWRSRPLCNFLLACMIVAFILPWFFRVSMF